MRPYKLAGCAALILLAAVSAGHSGDQVDSVAGNDPEHLIAQLSDPDPLIRAVSVQTLFTLGEGARPALRRALETAAPEARSEIDQVLLHMPWVRPADSDAVQEAFTGYADQDAQGACARIDNWPGALQGGAAPALLRVLLDDPSPAVRWNAAGALRLTLDDNAPVTRQLVDLLDGRADAESYLPAKENAPLLAVAGWGCRLTSPKRATELIEQAVRMEDEHPSAFGGQMDFAFLWLIEQASLQHDHVRVVALLRQQADRTAWTDDRVPDAVTRLFAEHVDFGPFDGFADDVRSYREYFAHPEMIYTLARLIQREGHPLGANVLDGIALLMSGDSADSHYLVGVFLASHGWNALAERELKWALAITEGNAPGVYFQLSALADARDDDLASAQYMEAGLLKLADSHGLVQVNRDGDVSPWNTDDGWTAVHWHYLRAARDAGDCAGVKLHLDKLLTMDQDLHILDRDPGIAADIVPALQDQGQNQQADKIFDAAYQSLKEKADAVPEDPMPKNNLAWLCACSGKHLDEAVSLAAQAVALDKEDAACLDTQAEAFMRTGKPAKAVEIETRALQMKPDDVYMKKQIKKFISAAAAGPAK